MLVGLVFSYKTIELFYPSIPWMHAYFEDLLAIPVICNAQTDVFPYGVREQKPDMPLSKAMERAYTRYMSPTTWGNELFTKFRHSPLEGLNYNGGDGTLSRRDPSKVVKGNGKYYVWYTRRSTPTPPRGADGGTDAIPSTDWDLAEIWYATAKTDSRGKNRE